MTTQTKPGVLIPLEGGDGAGKTDQVGLLKERCQTLFPGRNFVFTKEPGGGDNKLSLDIRELALNHKDAGDAEPGTLFGLMIASRFEHIGKFILPHLRNGDVVVCDRFEASTFAYQVMGQNAEYLRDLYHAHRAAIKFLLQGFESRTIVLDIDPQVAMERLAQRKRRLGDQNHFDARPQKFHEDVRAALKTYCSTINPTAIRIDGNPSIEEVHEALVQQIRAII